MIVISKRSIVNTIFAVALIFAVASAFSNDNNTVSVFAPKTAGKTIIIDAGHGYPDGGAVGADGTLEKDMNLDVSKALGDYFIQSGAKVIYTREDDNAVADITDKKLRDIKRQDLQNRREVLNSGEGDIFISIHMNKFEDSKYSGAQVFYDGKNSDSKSLAVTIQKYIKDYADSTNTREAKDAKNSIYILKDTSIPAVLIECGFLSNTQELEKLKTEKYQEELSFAIFCAVTDYISNYT